ncbi:MAG TPA: S9 family peptidase [Candidatus Acidoferrales bacterium]|nr:S9 family peptidase [Candidatus Acidoferrales bacterium]
MTPGTLSRVIALLVLSPLALSQAAPSRASAAVDSLPKVKKITQVAISPDGTQVAYIVDGHLTVVSLADNATHAIEVEGKLPLRSVAWKSDSKTVAFVADLPGNAPSAQIWTASSDGSSPSKRAELKGNVDASSFSPDGSRLAILFIEDMPRKAGPLEPMTPLAGVVGSKVYEQRIATIDLAANQLTQITPADMYVYEYDWTPDGRAWVAAAAHGDGDANWYVARLYQFDAHSGEPREIYKPKLQIASPQVSPDGKNVAFIEGLMSDEGPTGGDVFVVPIAGGSARNLTPNRNASPSAVYWRDASHIVFAEIADGHSAFAKVSTAGGTPQTLWSGEEFIGTDSTPTASFSHDSAVSAVVRESANTAPEVWAGVLGHWKQISTANADAKPAWGETRNFHWNNGKTRVQGMLTLPNDYDAAKTYPLVVSVHGGPSSACQPRWNEREIGAMSAMGYFVLCPNPRGSYGRGETFTQANVKDFGGGDFRDIMAGIDAVSKDFPIDPQRIGIRGHSYGGYMTMWAETQTHRFAAAVAGAGLSDWLSYYGVNEIDEWMIPFFGASIYDDPAVYAKSDPMHFVKSVQTPTLILVGDSDGEVPMEQSVEWWHALNTMKVPTALVVYPHEGHIFGNPDDSRDYTLRTLEWFEEWFAKAASSAKR